MADAVSASLIRRRRTTAVEHYLLNELDRVHASLEIQLMRIAQLQAQLDRLTNAFAEQRVAVKVTATER